MPSNISSPNNIVILASLPKSLPESLRNLQQRFPTTEIVGGLASGGATKDICLFWYRNGVSHRAAKGVICVAIGGDILVNCLVSRGVKPVGDNYQVSQTRGKSISSVRDTLGQQRTPTDVYLELFNDSVPFLGIQSEKGYSVHSIGAVNLAREEIQISTVPEVGDHVKFFSLENTVAVKEVGTLLDDAKEKLIASQTTILGGFLFTCLGRSHDFYGKANVTADCFQEKFPGIPLAGLFCNGEISPHTNFVEKKENVVEENVPNSALQSYTAVFSIFGKQKHHGHGLCVGPVTKKSKFE